MLLLWQCCHTNTARQPVKHWIINGWLTLHLLDWCMLLLWQCCHTNTTRQPGKHWITNGGLTLHLMDWRMPFLWQCHHANTTECNRCKNRSTHQGVVKVYKNALPFQSYSSLNVYGTFFCCSVHASVLRFSSIMANFMKTACTSHS